MKTIVRIISALLIFTGTVLFTVPAKAEDGFKTISAKALIDHECNASEWHFVITKIANKSLAPANIQVTWANGNTETVALSKFSGKVAHYVTAANLDSTVTSATATIYKDWSGQFNLSHGPCGVPESTKTPTPQFTATWTATLPTPTDTDVSDTPTPIVSLTPTITPTPIISLTPTVTQILTATPTQIPQFWVMVDVNCTTRAAGVKNGKFVVKYAVDSDVDFQEEVTVEAGDTPEIRTANWQNGTPTGETTITWSGTYYRNDGEVLTVLPKIPFTATCGSPDTPTPEITPGTATATVVPEFWADAGMTCQNRSAGVRNGMLTVNFKVDSDVDFEERVTVKAGDIPDIRTATWKNGVPYGPTTITWKGVFTRSDGEVVELESPAAFVDVCGMATDTPTITPTNNITGTITATAPVVGTATKLPKGGGAASVPTAPSVPFKAIGGLMIVIGCAGGAFSFTDRGRRMFGYTE